MVSMSSKSTEIFYFTDFEWQQACLLRRIRHTKYLFNISKGKPHEYSMEIENERNSFIFLRSSIQLSHIFWFFVNFYEMDCITSKLV